MSTKQHRHIRQMQKATNIAMGKVYTIARAGSSDKQIVDGFREVEALLMFIQRRLNELASRPGHGGARQG